MSGQLQQATGMKLPQVLAELHAAEETGRPIDREQALAEHPDLAADLREYFASRDRMREAIPPTVLSLRTGPREEPTLGPGSTRSLGNRPLPPGSSSDLPDPAVTSLMSSPPPTLPSADAPILTSTRVAGQPPRGQRFGDYELLEEIARGGMGIVYKARQVRLNRIVALKMILSGQLASADDVRRFYAEAEAAANLEHPGIVPIHEVGEYHGQHFFSMGYVEGESLAQRIAAGPLAPREAAELMRRIAEAVAYAHAHGVIHRDLKPANVLLSKSESGRSKSGTSSGGGSLRLEWAPKITDFGLAKRLGASSDLTNTGQILGTPHYMAPEQAAGKARDVQETADIYALGAILYAMLTGRPPFQAERPLDVLVQVLESEPTLPRKIQPDIPRELEWICLRCLEKQPARRYPTAADLAEDLDRFLQNEPVEARPATLGQKLERWSRKEPSLAAHLVALILANLVAQLRFIVARSDLPYHLRVTGILLAWTVVSIGCQQLLNRERWAEIGRFVWAACDAVLLTLFLYFIAPPRGPLLIGYPLLVAASGLFFHVRLVAFTTIVALVAFPVLQVLRPDDPYPIHYNIFFEIVLAILGFVVGHQVQRVRVLSQYYDCRHLP